MRENITLRPGDRVRAEGKSYKVRDSSVVSGELIEVKAQVNKHMAFECADTKCREYQTEKNGRVWTGRTGATKISNQDGLPACQFCGRPMDWRKADNRQENQ